MSPKSRERIRNIRKAANLTAQEAAKKADMHPATWSDIERGKNENPTLETLKRMAAALGVSLADFLDERRGLGSRCRRCGEPMLRTDSTRLGKIEDGFGGYSFQTEYEQYLCPSCGLMEWGAIGQQTIEPDAPGPPPRTLMELAEQKKKMSREERARRHAECLKRGGCPHTLATVSVQDYCTHCLTLHAHGYAQDAPPLDELPD